MVWKIPARFTIIFISGCEHFHLGDLSVLKDRKSMFTATRTFDERTVDQFSGIFPIIEALLWNGRMEAWFAEKENYKNCIWPTFSVRTRTNFLYLPLDQKMTTLTGWDVDNHILLWKFRFHIQTKMCRHIGPLTKQHPTKGCDVWFTLQLHCLDLIVWLYSIEHSPHICVKMSLPTQIS